MDIDKVIRAFSGAIWTWWFLAEDGSPATSIHRFFQREAWREATFEDQLAICVALPFVPLVTIGLAAFFTMLNASTVKNLSGKGIVQQMREQLGLAIRSAIPPPWYYIFELHDDAKRRIAGDFLNRWEMKSGLYRFLRDYNGGLPCPGERSSRYLRNKARFAERCSQFQLPSVPILLIVDHGKIRWVECNDFDLPEGDLFVKPMHGRGGKHAECWEYVDSGRYRSSKGDLVTGAELLARLQHASRRQALMLQPRLTNHPAIADLANGTLATVRTMSCRNERGQFEVTNAILRMARKQGAVVDNFHAGGIAANVDIHTGKLGRATGGAWGATREGWFERHPETGAEILGRQLPCWDATVALVQLAHGLAFPDQVVIGWDVGLLPSGPCLVEANKGPDLDIVQRVGHGPIGNERLGELLAFNLRLAAQAKYSRQSNRLATAQS